MMDPEVACESQALGGRKRAVVCSMPPSDVGTGMTASLAMGRPLVEDDCDELVVLGSGKK